MAGLAGLAVAPKLVAATSAVSSAGIKTFTTPVIDDFRLVNDYTEADYTDVYVRLLRSYDGAYRSERRVVQGVFDPHLPWGGE